ncbi:unnamed protein product [Heligmosomoides polygyrus]|uniref:Ubiquitin-related modifier 1 n=1 Tax=Heligmosomoides polygyrus TaxID=6339 RepID=A0A183FWQ2_HELPZ|nr:unnamed protein product [Heligmosomoides polygyrus]
MESMMEKRIDHLMAQPGVVGVCVSDANGLPLSARGSLNTDVAPLASQLITLCSQIEPMNPVVPQITLTGDHGKVTLSKHEDLIMAMGGVDLNLEFSGGCEFLVGNQKQHKVSIPCNEDFVTVAEVICYVRDEMLKVGARHCLMYVYSLKQAQ